MTLQMGNAAIKKQGCAKGIAEKRVNMQINIYYGGRGILEDPAIYVMNRITQVLEELRVNVVRYNLYEQKNGIAMLPNTLKEADAVILAVNVEWLGIGGLMAQFLDACWLYADKSRLKRMYMMPVVTSVTVGERPALLTLQRAWELLGGNLCSGICSYVEDYIEFETNESYGTMIEKKAENLYRTVKQKLISFPSSTSSIASMACVGGLELTPQESEQLSVYVSDDTYVKKQKEDIEELSQLFKEMLEQGTDEGKQEFIRNLKENFKPLDGDFHASFSINMTDTKKTLVVEVKNDKLHCSYGEKEDADVIAKTTREVMNKLVNGRTTFQGAFMSGAVTARGDFKILRTFDQLFQFKAI